MSEHRHPPGKTFAADPASISRTKKKELLEFLIERNVPFDQAQRAEFVEKVAEAVSVSEQVADRIPNGKKVAQMKVLAKAAQKLMAELNALSEDTFLYLRSFRDLLVVADNLKYQLPERYTNPDRRGVRLEHDLEEIEDCLSMLTVTTEFAIDNIPVSRQEKVDTRCAKALAYEIGRIYLGMTGKRPPYSKESWFLPFLQKVLFIGEESLKDVIENIPEQPA